VSDAKEYYYAIFHGKKKGDVNYLNIPCDPTIFYADFIANETKFYTKEEHDKARQYLRYWYKGLVDKYVLTDDDTRKYNNEQVIDEDDETEIPF